MPDPEWIGGCWKEEDPNFGPTFWRQITKEEYDEWMRQTEALLPQAFAELDDPERHGNDYHQ